ncbi:MAG: GTP-binding protein [Methanolobus sp.]|nr:GTP-binding protein [Methanolobus sp.]
MLKRGGKMKIIIIGGFLGSGKTTTLMKLSKHLIENGHKVAIIVNEVGEVGVDGETMSVGGLVTREITSGCICCTLLTSMEITLNTLMEEYGPDVVIIEPTGIAFPLQIKEGIELMSLEDLSFAPIVTLVDASRMTMEMKQIPRFIENQIKDSEIVCLNKIDLVDMETLIFVSNNILQLNPDAILVEFSAKNVDAKFRTFMDMLTGESKILRQSEHLNSIEMSGVGSYAGEYLLKGDELDSDKITIMLVHMLTVLKEKLKELNPDFIGHIKMTFKFSEGLIKANLTSSLGEPYVEILEEAVEDEQHLKFLSAITKVSREDLIRILDTSIEKILSDEGLGFEKLDTSHGPDIITL